jgi:hypothetical protein
MCYNPDNCGDKPRKFAQDVTRRTYIWKVPRSNLALDTVYND